MWHFDNPRLSHQKFYPPIVKKEFYFKSINVLFLQVQTSEKKVKSKHSFKK